MLLARCAIILTMMFARCPIPANGTPVDHHIDGALAGTKRHHDASFGPHRHEAGGGDKLDRQHKQSQRGQQTPCGFRLSDSAHHVAKALAATDRPVTRTKEPRQDILTLT